MADHPEQKGDPSSCCVQNTLPAGKGDVTMSIAMEELNLC